MKADSSKRYGFFLITLIIINLLSSGFFVNIFLAGSVFFIFMQAIQSKYFYTSLLAVFTFIIIETLLNFPIFSLTIISGIILLFIKPYLEKVFSSSLMAQTLNISLFYLFLAVLFLSNNHFSNEIIYIFLLNLFIDIILAGVLL